MGKKEKMWYNLKQEGYITLLSVLILGAVGMSISTSIILLGIGNSRSGFALEQSVQAKSYAVACAEEALMQIKSSISFTGIGSLFFPAGDCDYNVTSQGGQNRTITSQATVGPVVRKVKVIINKITPAIEVVSWQEVSDF